jgi:flagellar biogenesis protein FliO
LEFKILSLLLLAAALVWLVRRFGSVPAAGGRTA